jgi:F0F1-type ATP synthase membrane subunit b/b'
MTTRTDTQTQENMSEARERAQRAVEESGQKLGRQTQEAFDQLRRHDNLMRGNVAF